MCWRVSFALPSLSTKGSCPLGLRSTISKLRDPDRCEKDAWARGAERVDLGSRLFPSFSTGSDSDGVKLGEYRPAPQQGH